MFVRETDLPRSCSIAVPIRPFVPGTTGDASLNELRATASSIHALLRLASIPAVLEYSERLEGLGDTFRGRGNVCGDMCGVSPFTFAGGFQ